MRLTVKKWGNGACVRIPAAIMKAAQLKLGDTVDVRDEDGRIIIEPLAYKIYDIDELLTAITPDNLYAEITIGPTVRNEACEHTC